MLAGDRERTLKNIVRLGEAERQSVSAEIALVREDLEAQLGGTVSRAAAARQLGVSHTALDNWVASGDVPVVITKQGRKEIPIPALLEIQRRAAEERRSGRRKLHLLEPAMIEARQRAEEMKPAEPASATRHPADSHRRSERRSLAYHRALATRLRQPMVAAAQRKLRRWKEEARIDPRYAQAWEEVFALPIPQIRQAIAADDDHGRDLRQNSPLAGLLSEPERRKIFESV
ncbi:MAG: hypothetical protein ACJ76D_13460 [Solirubrobacterales bacterium]